MADVLRLAMISVYLALLRFGSPALSLAAMSFSGDTASKVRARSFVDGASPAASDAYAPIVWRTDDRPIERT